MSKNDRPPARAPAPYETELTAMKKIGRILAELPLDGRARVCAFVAAQFGTPAAKDPS